MPSISLVSEAETILRNWLVSSGAGEGTRLPSERALATQLGVRHYALNRAMARLIVEGVVCRDGYKLFFTPQPSLPVAPALSCHLIVYVRSTLLKSYRRTAKILGIDLKIHRFNMLEEFVAQVSQLDVSETDFVVFDPPVYRESVWQESVESLSKHGVPIVCTGNYLSGISSVSYDYRRALELLFSHLLELGHRELALMTLPASTSTSAEILDTWEALCNQNDLPTSSKRIHLPSKYFFLREEIEDMADRLVGDWNNVTALVVHNEPESNLPNLLEFLSKRRKRVPQDLSIVCLVDSNALHSLTPSISTAAFDVGLAQETTFQMAQRLARKRHEPGTHSPGHIRIQPELVLRSSTAPHPDSTAYKSRSANPANIPAFADSEKKTAGMAQALKSAYKHPYPHVALVARSRFAPLKLDEHMNRPLNFQRGWLGDRPLSHLGPGQHIIHGVPFNVMGGPRRSDCGAIVFHSIVNTKGREQKLPTRLRIPIHTKAKAIYILHGCGYTRFLKPFGSYGFYCGEKKIDEVTLVPLGLPPADFDPKNPPPEFSKVNIQDWWSDLPHMDFEHARMAPINQSKASDASTSQRHAYLYTLEWVNPFPETLIDYLDIEIDPTLSTTLGVLAITMLQP